MNENTIFDIKTLASPFADNAVGVDLRLSKDMNNPYRLMKDARNDARMAERQFLAGKKTDKSPAHWQLVYQYGVDILTHHSKDIEVLAWLIEALLRLHGFAGLHAGFQLTLSCFENFGTDLYPQLEIEESLEWKVKSLAGLNGETVDGTLIAPILNIAVTQNPTYAMWQYCQAKEIDTIEDIPRREKRLQNGAVSLDDFLQAVYTTPLTVLTKLQTDVTLAKQTFDTLNKKLVALFKDSAPPSSRIANALTDYHQELSHLIHQHKQIAQSSKKITTMQVIDDISTVAVEKNESHHYTRQSAIKELLVIADFIAHTEPHSPLPFMLRRVAEWADLSLPQLLSKMIKNSAELEQVFALTGIKPDSITT